MTVEELLAGVVIPIDKPRQWTSFQTVNKVKSAIRNHYGLKKFKIGHAGTLDPLATGLLLVCVGRATKEIAQLQAVEKVYTGTMVLGATTPCYDLERPIDHYYPYSHITPALLEEVKQQFIGDIQQVPPEYSACKIGGDRAYDLMRKGKEVALAAKTVHIDEIELTDFNAETMQMSIRVVCGKGTYIRSLARDIGRALQSGAYLTALCRTRLGAIRMEDCITIDDFPQWLEQQEVETAKPLNTETSK